MTFLLVVYPNKHVDVSECDEWSFQTLGGTTSWLTGRHNIWKDDWVGRCKAWFTGRSSRQVWNTVIYRCAMERQYRCMYMCVDLKPRVLSVNLTIINVNELIREIRLEIEDIVIGLDLLPQRMYHCVIHWTRLHCHRSCFRCRCCSYLEQSTSDSDLCNTQ